jgi:tetratricopeptide (TPR) repeat protein
MVPVGGAAARRARAGHRVIVSDLHDAALYAWRDAGVRDRVLIHVDAHHDADSCEWDFVTISNFVWWAMSEGIVREVYWVVPEPGWRMSSGPAMIADALLALARQHDSSAGVEANAYGFTTQVAGKRFTACPLSRLPPLGGALLDIDIDYFLIADIAAERPPVDRAAPWMWPVDLLHALKGVETDPTIVTIATSTRGGFTPLEWKYLGDELAARLSGAPVEGYDRIRGGFEAECRADGDVAKEHYRRAMELMPVNPGPAYRLALLHLARGADREARRLFGAVLERDSTYRGPDSRARRWHDLGDVIRARQGYVDLLRLDPSNPYAELGIAQLAADRDDHPAAIAHFERALAVCGTLVDAERGIAQSFERVGERDRAARHYARSIELELAGHAPLSAPIASCPPRVLDETHWENHRRLARLRGDDRWLRAVDHVARSEPPRRQASTGTALPDRGRTAES